MKYFIDTEFIEGFHKPLFGKRRHFIDLISIGIVCEDGREYYAVSKEFRYKDADKWVQENVIDPLFISTVSGDGRNHCSSENFQCAYGKSNKQIAAEIMIFIWQDTWNEWVGPSDEFFERGKRFGWDTDTPIEFYAYYADYDWVLFCSLFGRMIDLPKGFPMYCFDLKQTLDATASGIDGFTFEQSLAAIKNNPKYPKQENEHNALDDAKWNMDLHKFLLTL